MLVPAMQSTGMRSSSRTFSTPICAPPRAPPPASASATRGRLPGAGAAAASCAVLGVLCGAAPGARAGVPLSCAATWTGSGTGALEQRIAATSCPFGVVDRRLPPDLAASAIAGTNQSTAAPPAGNQTSGLQGSAGGRDEGKGNSLSVAVCDRCWLRMSAGRAAVSPQGAPAAMEPRYPLGKPSINKEEPFRLSVGL